MSRRLAILHLHTLTLAVLPLVGACSEESSIQVADGTSKEERLAQDQLALQERIARLEASGRSEELVRSVKALLNIEPQQTWFDMGGWNLGRHELAFVDFMNSPVREDGTGPIGALELGDENHPLHVIAEYSRELAEHGIDLLVIPVPNRAQVRFDLLPDVSPLDDCLGGDLGMPRLLLEMSRAGIELVDLYPAFAAARAESSANGEGRSLFLSYNPHWSPYGVRVAAGAIAERSRALDWLEPGPDREGVDFFVRQERLPCTSPRYGDAPQEPEEPVFDRVVDQDGNPARKGSRRSPILVLGDSYGVCYVNEGASLVSHLYAQLGHRLDSICVSSGGENTVWQNVARRGDSLRGKKLVIWIFTRSVLSSRKMRKVEIFRD